MDILGQSSDGLDWHGDMALAAGGWDPLGAEKSFELFAGLDEDSSSNGSTSVAVGAPPSEPQKCNGASPIYQSPRSGQQSVSSSQASGWASMTGGGLSGPMPVLVAPGSQYQWCPAFPTAGTAVEGPARGEVRCGEPAAAYCCVVGEGFVQLQHLIILQLG